jgi:hypothetical protein
LEVILRVIVEAACLAWIEVDLDADAVIEVRVHALPENVAIFPGADVLASNPEREDQLDDEMRERAFTIAASAALPEPFRLMR